MVSTLVVVDRQFQSGTVFIRPVGVGSGRNCLNCGVLAAVAVRLQSVAAGHHCEAAASLQPSANVDMHVF